MRTDLRPTFSTPQALGLFAGIGLVAISFVTVVLLSIRVPPAAVAKPVAPAAPIDRPPAPVPAKPAEAEKPAPVGPQPDPIRVGKLQPEPAPAPPPSRYVVGRIVEQDVTFTRRSACRIQGIDFVQHAAYSFDSDIEVIALKPDGGCTMKQTIRSTRLVSCDADQRKDLQDALEKTHGKAFEIAVGPDGAVRSIKGPKDAVTVKVQNDFVKAATFRVWSLLDDDGWKELAAITLLQPPTLQAGKTWERPLRHDWGPLGAWDGRTTYRVTGKQSGGDRIDFEHVLTYSSPKAGAGNDSPVRIVRAEFPSPTATGFVLYDAAKGRVSRAEEAFLVRGRVVASALGSEVAVDVEEQQRFQLSVRKPAEASLRGQPKK